MGDKRRDIYCYIYKRIIFLYNTKGGTNPCVIHPPTSRWMDDKKEGRLIRYVISKKCQFKFK